MGKENCYDITARLTPYWDPHMFFPVIAFLEERQIYPGTQLIKAKIEILKKTSMLDYLQDQYTALGLEAPDDSEARAKVSSDLDDAVINVRTLMQEAEKVQDDLKAQSKTSDEYRKREAQCKSRMPENSNEILLKFARLQFDIGSYDKAGEALTKYLVIARELLPADMDDVHVRLNHTWGLLASCILNGPYNPQGEYKEGVEVWLEKAPGHILDIDAMLDKDVKFTQKELRLQRAWLIHWALWPLFLQWNYSQTEDADRSIIDTRARLLDLLFQERHLQIVQVACPHLVRYYAAMCIVQPPKNRKEFFQNKFQLAMNLMQSVAHRYSDPFTVLLESLYSTLHFDVAQQKLAECVQASANDYYLHHLTNEVEASARLALFERYCRIHHSVNIDMISKKLSMEPEAAERWIVNLIRKTRLDAKVDSERSLVEMEPQLPNAYQQVCEKTKNAIERTRGMLEHLKKKEAERSQVNSRMAHRG